MKLLIAGGCGFLVSNLAAHALERGEDLAMFDDLSRREAWRTCTVSETRLESSAVSQPPAAIFTGMPCPF
jgi:nucleoside-diphosphate-sugar epimerase